jgi:hypothetical protein
MNELNSDFVLWITLGALVLTAFSFVGFALKAFSAMEKDDDEVEDDNK